MVRLARFVLSSALAVAVCANAAFAQAGPAPVATATPSLVARVFQQSYREAIDSRCPKARSGADAIAANVTGVDLNIVNATEKEFFECAKLPRLPQAKDQTLYMELAAATCFYVIATRTGNPTKKAALTYAAQIAGNLAPPPDHRQASQGTGGSAGGGGSNAMTGEVSHNAVHVNETEDADPLGSRYDPATLRQQAAELQELIYQAGG